MTNITTEEFDSMAERGDDLSEFFEDCTPVWTSNGSSRFEITLSNELVSDLYDESDRRELNLADTVAEILAEWLAEHKAGQSSDSPTAA